MINQLPRSFPPTPARCRRQSFNCLSGGRLFGGRVAIFPAHHSHSRTGRPWVWPALQARSYTRPLEMSDMLTHAQPCGCQRWRSLRGPDGADRLCGKLKGDRLNRGSLQQLSPHCASRPNPAVGSRRNSTFACCFGHGDMPQPGFSRPPHLAEAKGCGRLKGRGRALV